MPPLEIRREELFERALQLPPDGRVSFVSEECADDPALRDDVISLLDAHDAACAYFDHLSAEVVAPVLSVVASTLGKTSGFDMAGVLQAKLADTYRIERELGGGGMSRVFVAEDLRLKRRIVIKVLPPEMAPAARAEQFNREIELAARLQHPHIVPLLATGSVDGMLYYTMPFVVGESLGDRLGREGPLPVDEAVRIWRDVLDALAHAHASGVIHRDVKPGNILLSGRHALVTDFGISGAIETAAGAALAAAPGLMVGTPAYMAPEEAGGARSSDHRADIYAAGLVMYEMLAGSPPFVGDSARELLLAHRTVVPPPLLRSEVPERLIALVMLCLAKSPAERPQSADAVLSQLEIGATETKDSSAERNEARRRRTIALLVIAILALPVTVLTAIRLPTESPRIPDAREESRALIVLPWVNLGTDPAGAALADVMTRELAARLGRSGDLRVIPGASVSAWLGRRTDVRRIFDSLRVSHLLEGSLRKAGSGLSIDVRLVDARDTSAFWSKTYELGLSEVFNVRDDIVRAVAQRLAVRLPEDVQPVAGARRYTPKIAAYEWYLRGVDVALLRTEIGRRQGIEYFERAISIDSTYVDAYAGLALMYVWLSRSPPGTARDSRLERARQAALKAVTLDDSDADARVALGWVHLVSGDYRAAEAELSLAVALDPRVPKGHEGLARVFMMTGRPVQQLEQALLGVNTDPFSHSAIRELALALATNGRCDESLDQLRALKSLSPPAAVAGVIRGQCYASMEMWPEAIAEFQWAADNSATAGPALLGYALARAGSTDDAATILSDLLAGRQYSHGSWGIAVVYAGMRDYDQAFAWLDRAVDDHTMHFYIVHPLFADLHADPRFERIKERMRVRSR